MVDFIYFATLIAIFFAIGAYIHIVLKFLIHVSRKGQNK